MAIETSSVLVRKISLRVSILRAVSLVGLLAAAEWASAKGLDWPADRLLPAFSTPAATIDCIDTTHASGAEVDLFASLEGIVNRMQPRIACAAKGDQLDWLKIHQLPHQSADGYKVVAKYRDEITGLVVTDPDQPDTLNLATTLAGLNNELICAPELLSTLTNAPYNFQIKDDLRGRFTGKFQVYEFLRTNCWPRCTHRVLAGLSGNVHGSLRDYLVAIQSPVVWFNPNSAEDAKALSPFVSGMKPVHSVYLGWWPDEGAGLEFVAKFGIPVLASDFFDNGSLFSGVVQPVTAPAIPPPPPLENKIYVAMIFSDGDNVQYMQHFMKRTWGNSARGSVPMGWTVSPLSVDLDPAMLNYYYQTATTNDCLVSGPSGAGYTRLNFWKTDFLPEYTKNSDAYLRRSGIRIITVWNKVTDPIADSFARNCPTLLAITGQEGGYYAKLHDGLPVMGYPDRAGYADTVSQMKDGLASAAKKWNGSAPVFIALQANAWNIGPADFQNIAAGLDKNKFVVVRPDQLFMLLKQSLTSR
jgi:hypothetical protein